ncbi:hypothetical protein GWI33_019320 [Rhynchophorus ferrugineus]|uniref:DUF4774 domain-containing protein n=1 Tax=Rhynchophorus ferrugineus TaxID=354439 RepID=A0A834HUM9_RHYFE|nr:hypothetical protein GWI33_019320 [Rhynchophorus ferrugineus]
MLQTNPSEWIPLLPIYGRNEPLDNTASSQFYRFPRYFTDNNSSTHHPHKDNPLENGNVTNSERVVTVNRNVEDSANVANINQPPSLAPYRMHPLFEFIKNQNTIAGNRILRFRSNKVRKESDITTLILKPQSTAVAGVEGKAVSNPLSKAILRKGIDVDILFEPAAVAIAGPGGIAHAQSDLEIHYEDFP